jgi:hypothetical protein
MLVMMVMVTDHRYGSAQKGWRSKKSFFHFARAKIRAGARILLGQP